MKHGLDTIEDNRPTSPNRTMASVAWPLRPCAQALHWIQDTAWTIEDNRPTVLHPWHGLRSMAS